MPPANKSRSLEVSLAQQPVQVSIADKKGPIMNILSLIGSVAAITVSVYTLYYSELREGHIEVISPSRVAWVRLGEGDQIHGRSRSDILLLSFVIYNNGNKLRAIESVDLSLTDGNNQYQLEAVGQFDRLKDITYFTDQALEGRLVEDERGNPIPDYHYSLITSLPIEGNVYYGANLLFLIKDESENNFLQLDDTVEYTGMIQVNPYNSTRRDQVSLCFKFLPNPIFGRVMVSTDNNISCESS